MFLQEDRTFEEIREKSVDQWLEQMKEHEDITVRSGVKAVTDHIASLKRQIKELEEKNKVKDKYLRKIKEKN